MCVCVWICVCGDQRTVCRSPFSPSTMWISETVFRPSDLAASSFTFWAIAPASGRLFYYISLAFYNFGPGAGGWGLAVDLDLAGVQCQGSPRALGIWREPSLSLTPVAVSICTMPSKGLWPEQTWRRWEEEITGEVISAFIFVSPAELGSWGMMRLICVWERSSLKKEKKREKKEKPLCEMRTVTETCSRVTHDTTPGERQWSPSHSNGKVGRFCVCMCGDENLLYLLYPN